jgi:hypothetical protein
MAEFGLTNPAPANQVPLGIVDLYGPPGPGNTWRLLQPDEYGPQEQSTDILQRGRTLAQQTVPLQVSNLLDALGQLRARAAGSTAEIFPDIMGQLGQLRAQYSGASQALARRLGYAGGGQTERDQGRALAQATQQYGSLITQQQQAGFAQLLNTLGGLQPQLSGAARAPSVTTRTPGDVEGGTINPALYGKALASLVGTGRQIYDYYAGPRADAANAASTIEGFRQQGFTQGLTSNPAYTPAPTYNGPEMDAFGYTGLQPGDYQYNY